MSDDLFYLMLLIGGAAMVVAPIWVLDQLFSKYWPTHRWHSARGKRMEDERHELWIRQFLIEFDKRKGKRQRISDMKSAYLERLKSLFADYIVETMLDSGKDASDFNKELDRLGNLLDLPDLFFKSQAMLKERINNRLGTHKPVPLPDIKPPVEKINYAKINPDPLARRYLRWHTSLKSWLRTRTWRRQMPT